MTIEKFVKDWLFENTLWEDECDKVFECMKATSSKSGIRWSDNIEGYPPQLKSALIYSARQEAISWLTVNKPQHFSLLMLKGE